MFENEMSNNKSNFWCKFEAKQRKHSYFLAQRVFSRRGRKVVFTTQSKTYFCLIFCSVMLSFSLLSFISWVVQSSHLSTVDLEEALPQIAKGCFPQTYICSFLSHLQFSLAHIWHCLTASIQGECCCLSSIKYPPDTTQFFTFFGPLNHAWPS